MAIANGGDKTHEQQSIKQLVEEATEKGRELLNEGLETAKGILEKKTAELKVKAAEYGLDEAEVTVRTYVKKNPWRSVAIAVAIGVFLGRLTAPSKHD
jgi:ElaB/YqjD/DUF883 family membrane-anchored ribosome-binding protein